MKDRIQALRRRHTRLLFVIVLVVAMLGGGSIGVSAIFADRLFPRTVIDSVDVGGLSRTQAYARLATQPLPDFPLTLTLGDKSHTLPAREVGLYRDIDHSINAAHQRTTGSNPLQNLWRFVQYVSFPESLTSPLRLEESAVVSFIAEADAQLGSGGELPTIVMDPNSPDGIRMINGSLGIGIDQSATTHALHTLQLPQENSLEVTTTTIGKVLSDDQINQSIARAKRLQNTTVTLTHDITKHTLRAQDLIPLLDHPDGLIDSRVTSLIETIAQIFEQPPKDAQFDYDPITLAVETFIPHEDGVALDRDALKTELTDTITSLLSGDGTDTSITLRVHTASPAKPLSATNSLGIVERIGFGESHYAGSIPSRIHNVSRASEVLNYTLLRPGETFSFNQRIGEISRRTGYQPAFIIQGGKTVLGDGGGVCQVSTTLFRALLDSGLHITHRKQHSYRVGYYEQDQQPGFDAAVFSGATDLRFTNDSPQHILIVFRANSQTQHLVTEIYGTSDGRSTEIIDYKKWGARSAPAPVYFDDPTLPAGKLIQIDWAVGGIRTSFSHVTRDAQGAVIRETVYTSNYIPWSAKYRRGTGGQ